MGKTTLYAIIIGALLSAGLAFYIHYVAAETYSAEEVTVTAEVKPSCIEDVYREDCIRKVTDEVAKTLAELVAQEDIVAKEVEVLNQRREAFNQAAFNLETIANK